MSDPNARVQALERGIRAAFREAGRAYWERSMSVSPTKATRLSECLVTLRDLATALDVPLTEEADMADVPLLPYEVDLEDDTPVMMSVTPSEALVLLDALGDVYAHRAMAPSMSFYTQDEARANALAKLHAVIGDRLDRRDE